LEKLSLKKIGIHLSRFLILCCFSSFYSTAESRSFDLSSESDRRLSIVNNGIISGWQDELVFDYATNYTVAYSAVFYVDDPLDYASVQIVRPLYMTNMKLNGIAISLPIEGMEYETVPGISTELLHEGRNELTIFWTHSVDDDAGVMHTVEEGENLCTIAEDYYGSPNWMRISNANPDIDPNNVYPGDILHIPSTTTVRQCITAEDMEISVIGLDHSELEFQTEPVLGYAGTDFFTLTCRVNFPVEVLLHVDGELYLSEPKLLHSFRIDGLTADTEYQYILTARFPYVDMFSVINGPHTVRTLTDDEDLRFAVLGDSRSYPNDWAEVATSVLNMRPDLMVFAGDMVTNGRKDYLWDQEFFSPAADLLAEIPLYAVIGNHEQNCTLFQEIFLTPGGKNWVQQVGNVLLVGIDGAMDWSTGTYLFSWLESLLAASDADFIFLTTHYPAWSSGYHGRVNASGIPREEGINTSRSIIMPLLEEYNATAMFAGHDHIYERSEPPGGVSMIVTGGAGAPMYSMVENAAIQNPYSVVYAREYHFCILTVDGDVCTMEVFTNDGGLIDSRTWYARVH